MSELYLAAESSSFQAADYLGYLVENAVRCYRLAGGLSDPDYTRQLAELGQEYAAQALQRGADPTSLPQPAEWQRIAA